MSQEKYEVFICYSRKDIAIVDKICAALENEKISYFIDRKGLEENNETLKSLSKIMANSELFLLVASENSYGSDFILDQIREAQFNAPMVSYVIDGARLPLEIDDLFGFMDWYNIDDHPIDTGLMDNLVRMLGRGYRKSVLTEREKYLLALPDDEFVRVKETDKFGDRYGYKLKSTGEVIIPIKYNHCDLHFHEGLAKVKNRSYEGFVDKTGEEVVPLEYYRVNAFSEGLAAVWPTDGGCGFVDRTGKVVIPTKYSIIESFSEGLAAVSPSNECKFGFINHKGETVIPFEYDDASSFSEGLAKVRIKNKLGFIDKEGRMAIPIKYDDALSFREGLAGIQLDGLWGYIDKNGKEIIPIRLEYDAVFPFRGGLACVKSGRKYGFINTEGKEVIPVIYEFSIYITAIGFMNGETCRVKLNDEYFWIDKNGNRVYESTQKYWDNKIPLCELGKLSIFVETE